MTPDDDGPVFSWEPVGTAGRARLTVTSGATGEVVDIDTIDLGRSQDRAGYAVRVAAMFKAERADVERELLRIAEERLGTRPSRPTMLTLATALDSWQATPDTPRIVTGFRGLDDLAGGGLPLGTISVIAGRPGAGKSALALQVCLGGLLEDPELRVVWGLGEMSHEALACRAVAVGSALLGASPVTLPQAGRRSAGAVAVADELRRDIGGRLGIVSPLTIEGLELAVRDAGAKLLVVDYMQLVRVTGAADRRQEVDAAVKALRELALVQAVAVVAVSNIAKSVNRDTRAGAVGKESSEIDFAADLLLLGEPDDEADERGLRSVRWRCIKHRHGVQRDIVTEFDGAMQVFTTPEAETFPEFDKFAPGGAA